MDPQATPQTPVSPAPRVEPAPFMDVVAQKRQGSADDSAAESQGTPAVLPQASTKPVAQQVPSPAKVHSGGVNAAIAATVVVILGLAAMAVYAYTQMPL